MEILYNVHKNVYLKLDQCHVPYVEENLKRSAQTTDEHMADKRLKKSAETTFKANTLLVMVLIYV